jgi:antitoxin component YwqK of YwqJK toxin-antitoxin module
MKHTPLFIMALMLIVGCSPSEKETSSDKETSLKENGPIDGWSLKRNEDLIYAPGSDKPYSGEAVWYHDNGQKRGDGTYKDGLRDGKWTTWYKNGQKKKEETYKDGKLIEQTNWDEDGNER